MFLNTRTTGDSLTTLCLTLPEKEFDGGVKYDKRGTNSKSLKHKIAELFRVTIIHVSG